MNSSRALFFVLLTSASLHAQFSDGVLDTAFDTDGITQVNFGTSNADTARGIAAQADGKLVIVGSSIVSGQNQMALARLTSTGALDATFGTGGRVLTNAGPSDEIAYAVAVQPDGKIIVAGTAFGSSFDFLVARYTSAGVLDSSFGTGGLATIPVSGEGDIASAITLQSDGKIVVAGFASIAGNQDFAVARLTAAGVLDSTFSGDGIATVNLGSFTDQATSVAVQSDGKVVLAGLSYVSGDADFALARFTDAGALDTSFEGDGKVVTALAAGQDYANALVIQPTGEIVAGGISVNGGSTDFALVRYTSAGTLDTSFGTGGIVFTPFGTSSDACAGLALQSDGKIIAAGSSSVATGSFGAARYLSNGALDTSFGTGGKVSTAFGSGAAGAVGVALQADGRITLVGNSSSVAGGADFGVIQFRVPQPDIVVTQGIALTDGAGSLGLGAALAGQDGAPVTFTITNPGNAELNSLAITKSGTDAADFEVGALSATTLAAGGGSVTFTVTFSPAAGGVKTAALQIASNVSGTKNPFDIALTATALTTAQDTDNDGLNDAAEFQMAALGFDWQLQQNALVATYHATANGAGLFTPSQVSTQRLPMPLIQRNPLTNAVTLTIGLDGTPITAPQTSVQSGKYRLEFTTPGNTAFFRLTTP